MKNLRILPSYAEMFNFRQNFSNGRKTSVFEASPALGVKIMAAIEIEPYADEHEVMQVLSKLGLKQKVISLCTGRSQATVSRYLHTRN